MSPRMRCSICDREFDPDDEGVVMPFCSHRCKRIDAVRWLDERYGLPYERDEGAVDETRSPSDREESRDDQDV